MVIEDLESVTYDWSGAAVDYDEVDTTSGPAGELSPDQTPEGVDVPPETLEVPPEDLEAPPGAPQTAWEVVEASSDIPDTPTEVLQEPVDLRSGDGMVDVEDAAPDASEPDSAPDDNRSTDEVVVEPAPALPKVTTMPASPRDGALLLDLYIARYADELDWNVSHQRSILIMRAQAEEARLAKQYPNLDRLTIYVDGVPAGRMVAACSETVFRLLDISLLPRFRGQGIASRLLGEMLGEAKAARLRIRLEVPKTGPALRLFQRLGFGQPIDLGNTLRLTWTPPPLEDDEEEPLPSREAHRGTPLPDDDFLAVGYPVNGTAGLLAVSD